MSWNTSDKQQRKILKISKMAQIFTSTQLNEQKTDLAKTQAELADLKKTVKANEEGMKEAATKLLYLEAYSRRENIRLMNIVQDGQTEEPKNVEETLKTFLQRNLGYLDARPKLEGHYRLC